jgi:hypothetical protein
MDAIAQMKATHPPLRLQRNIDLDKAIDGLVAMEYDWRDAAPDMQKVEVNLEYLFEDLKEMLAKLQEV